MSTSKNRPNTLGALKAAGYTYKTIKDELRDNLVAKIKADQPVFEGIIGYEHTVIPQLKKAILSKHNINLLGLRGQAKTRIARLMTELLDEFIPVVKGSTINDDPFKPISKMARDLIAEKGDDTPIEWLGRSDRFFEKLATPDVSVADLIGDIDPIKAANLKLSYADEEVIHYGMVPRANRCLFVINELPDLQARIQVALFSILQEGEVQIRGFKMKLPLDVAFVFTANPEDYTNRGSIVTPLKDRIGSQILTHYPKTIALAKEITRQEAKPVVEGLFISEAARDLIEAIAFEARTSEYVDAKSGVSARLSISAFENAVSGAELRMIQNNESSSALRVLDIMNIGPAITGKVELVYEGEQEGADFVAQELIKKAVLTTFEQHFPKIEKLEKKGAPSAYDTLYTWFFENDPVELLDDASDEFFQSELDRIKPLDSLLKAHFPDCPNAERHFYKEIILWGLVAKEKLNSSRIDHKTTFNDLYNSYFSGLE